MHLRTVWQCRERGTLRNRRQHLAQESIAADGDEGLQFGVSLRLDQGRIATGIGVAECRQDGYVFKGKVFPVVPSAPPMPTIAISRLTFRAGRPPIVPGACVNPPWPLRSSVCKGLKINWAASCG